LTAAQIAQVPDGHVEEQVNGSGNEGHGLLSPGDLDGVRYSVEDGIATVVLDRPPVNAFSLSLYRELARLFVHVAADASVRVVILTSASQRVFSGGADVKEMAALDGEGRALFAAVSLDARTRFRAIPVPVVAAITGKCVGAGLMYPAMCDYRVAAEHAEFAMPEIDHGLVAGGGEDFMQIGMPAGALRLMMFTGRRLSAQEGLRAHLVDEVVPADSVLDRARERARLNASNPRDSLVQMKQAINAAGMLRAVPPSRSDRAAGAVLLPD
jgi:enoyl-CoA hydratase